MDMDMDMDMENHSGIADSGTYFQIVPSTRKIMVPIEYKVIGTVGEHNAEQLTFKCPKLIDGHDIANCAKKYIAWKNINGDVGHDELKNMTDDGDYLYFTWDVSNGLTVGVGLVSFSVHFEDVDTNDRTLYRWSTTTCSECEILDSINAVLGAYEAVYVSGDTLVFSDYNPVKDATLTIETNGLIPEGTMKIDTNGSYDVGEVAQVEVAVEQTAPVITVSDSGLITAREGGAESRLQLTSDYDPDFIPENIANGQEIFGVTGTFGKGLTNSACTILNMTTMQLDVYHTVFEKSTGEVSRKITTVDGISDKVIRCMNETLVEVWFGKHNSANKVSLKVNDDNPRTVTESLSDVKSITVWCNNAKTMTFSIGS